MKSLTVNRPMVAQSYLSFILIGFSLTRPTSVSSFSVAATTARSSRSRARTERSINVRSKLEEGVVLDSSFREDDTSFLPVYATLTGYISSTAERQRYESALERQGFDIGERPGAVVYRFHPASGMLQLVPTAADNNNNNNHTKPVPPRWVPVVTEQENVLVKNGWSFLDVDESETVSAFDVEAANREGLYQPKWQCSRSEATSAEDDSSNLGFSLRRITEKEVLAEADHHISDQSRKVLLHGATDPPHRKVTNNQVDWTGSLTDREHGIFACAIGGLPLFSTNDFSATTASGGWLSFCRPLTLDHVRHVEPSDGDVDQRVEVVCAKSGCHLGHYFGRDAGYCINASALNFYAAGQRSRNAKDGLVAKGGLVGPVSYRCLETAAACSPAMPLLQQVLRNQVPVDTVILGAGCFWRVEHALRRLPGVLETVAGYCGGDCPNVTYKRVCQGDTGYAEVVRVDFDAATLDPRVLFDCFLALHDPTKVRAHGKHATGSGQYRSCIFLPLDSTLLPVAQDALNDCGAQLNKDVATDLRRLNGDVDECFVPAEERHQRHEERRWHGEVPVAGLSTLSLRDWLAEYGRRSDYVLGSANTLNDQAVESRFLK